MEEFTLEHREDVWKIPPEARVLRINCGLNIHSAHEIVTRCRELDRIVFSAHAFMITPREARDYLNENIYHITVEGEFEHHGVPQSVAKRIRERYARGDSNLESLALQFNLPKEKIWHIIHGKAPAHAK